MIAIILAAGYGTRLYPLTKYQAKPLLDVCGRPLIDYLIDKLAALDNINTIFVVTNNKFFDNFKTWLKTQGISKRIRIINDKTTSPDDRLGAVGDIIYTINKEKINDDIIVLGGDNFFEEGLDGFIKFCNKKLPNISLAAFDIKSKILAKRFGIIEVDKRNKIINFKEKPQRPKSTLAAACLYFFPKQKLALFNDYAKTHHSKDASGNFIQWLYKNDDIFSFVFKKAWFDIGHTDTYRQINKFLHFKFNLKCKVKDF